LFSQIILVVEHTLKDDDGILQKICAQGTHEMMILPWISTVNIHVLFDRPAR